ncbi:pyridoxal-phosphate dependent enzyme [Actinokineospora sp. UTMC 2448]|uniref:pyridoxal-phosphate dependent enzyme n=1 Tax=Actinokineospora sp. UTMC 2448 TaxID=2268449 RepID=UPI002164B0C2|nr:pyridoxal-phosphate dependent enzyme [Actinokineospora sp. UTMC 2448]UVS80508.1 Cysteine synthase [Actinokineospora sp. UTMC 2448]
MDDHIADALSRPALLRLDDGITCLRFETMKVVSALAAVRHLLDRGTIAPGDTLVDSSSGIYAHALALACHRYGLRCHIVASTTVDRTLRTQLEILGATVEPMPPTPSLKLDQNRRVARVQEILRANPRHHWMRQYHDDIHYLGYRPIAELVHRELGTGDLTIVGGVGTGASTGGLASYLRESDPDVRLVGVQPFDSVTFGSEHVHDPDIIIAGIGSSIPFANVVHEFYDTMHWVGFHAALAGGVALLRGHAVFAGLSAGAAYLAARWERRVDPSRQVVFLAADTGHRYVEAAYSRHREVPGPEHLAPRQIASPADMAPPWSRMDWDRAPAPAAASAVDGVRAAS